MGVGVGVDVGICVGICVDVDVVVVVGEAVVVGLREGEQPDPIKSPVPDPTHRLGSSVVGSVGGGSVLIVVVNMSSTPS